MPGRYNVTGMENRASPYMGAMLKLKCKKMNPKLMCWTFGQMIRSRIHGSHKVPLLWVAVKGISGIYNILIF